MIKHLYECEYCGIEFLPKRRNSQKYCCTSHRVSAFELKKRNLEKHKEVMLQEDISNKFLLENGFTRSRYFDKQMQQFRVLYTTEGYDCKILISPPPQYIGGMPPEKQVEEFSDIDLIAENHYRDWNIFINKTKNHLATFQKKGQLINLMNICECPLEIIDNISNYDLI